MDTKELIKRFEQSKNKSWCPVPWITASTTTNGHYRLCVQANSDLKTRGLYYDQTGKPLTAKDHRVTDSRNSELAKDVRKTMLEGQQHSSCLRCQNEETSGLVSRRILSRFNYSQLEEKITLNQCMEKTLANGSIKPDDFSIVEVDVRMGNRCNLACRSCYPGESSGWYQEWMDTKSKNFRSGDQKVELMKLQNGKVEVKGFDPDWTQNSSLFKHLHEDAPDFEYIHIVGGEPLLINEHFKALEKFVESGKANKITLDYNSNITLIPKKVLGLWEHFHKVRVGYSIDGVGKVNDYIRYPSRWQTIEKNLRLLDSSKINLEIWPTVTVMAYNVLYIPEIIQWQIESNFQKQNLAPMLLFLVPHFLRNPVEMNAQTLPTPIKAQIAQKYQEFQEGWFENYLRDHVSQKEQDVWRERLNYILSTIISFVKDKDLSQHLPQFFSRTNAMDSYRKQNFGAYLPELEQALREHKNNQPQL